MKPPEELISRLENAAIENLKKDNHLQPVILGFKDSEMIVIEGAVIKELDLDWNNSSHRQIIYRLAYLKGLILDIKNFVFITEAWVRILKEGVKSPENYEEFEEFYQSNRDNPDIWQRTEQAVLFIDWDKEYSLSFAEIFRSGPTDEFPVTHVGEFVESPEQISFHSSMHAQARSEAEILFKNIPEDMKENLFTKHRLE